MGTELKKEIYLDQAATSEPCYFVWEDILYGIEHYWYNESSIYQHGKTCEYIIDIAKSQIAELINCEPDEIYFTPSATISNNWALYMASEEDMKIYYSPLEHPSISNSIHKGNTSVDKDGMPMMNLLDYKLYDDKRFKFTPFITYMTVNNETGFMISESDSKALADIIHDAGGWFHSDISQAVGHVPIDVKKRGLDLATLSFQKMEGVRGLSVLYIKNGFPKSSFLSGGHQQEGLFPGTMPVYLIYAMGKQCERIKNKLDDMIKQEKKLRESLKNAIKMACDGYTDIEFIENESDKSQANNILSVIFKDLSEFMDNKRLLSLLDMAGVQCSSGSACNSGSNEPSKVLTALGYDTKDIDQTLRFSFDYRLTEEEILVFKDRLKNILKMVCFK